MGGNGSGHRPSKAKGHPARYGPAWEECRRIVNARDKVCGICRHPLVPSAKAGQLEATEIDHYPVTKAMMDMPGRYTEQQIHQLATSPNNCRAVHVSCHRGAGPPPALNVERRGTREW